MVALLAGAISATAFALLAPTTLSSRAATVVAPLRGGANDVAAADVQVSIARLNSDVRSAGRDVGLKIAAGLAAVAAGLLAWARHEQARADARRSDKAEERADRAHFNRRFADAVGFVGSASPAIQLGGLYAIEQLTLDSETHVQPCIDVLCAFVRQAEKEVVRDINTGSDVESISPMAQAALSIIARNTWRRHATDGQRPEINLAGACLTRARLERADLQSANLHRADLEGSNLRNANLTEADLTQATMVAADLQDAVANRASFVQAQMRDANCLRTSLDHARLTGADCTDVSFFNASCRGANLNGIGRIKTVYMSDLTGANLSGTDLSAANMFATKLDQVYWDSSTTWPDGFDPPPSALDD